MNKENPMKRFYFPEKIAAQKEIAISGSDARHMVKVLRLKPGDNIVVFDGYGADYDAEIVSISPDRVMVFILRKCPARPESRARITVAQALLKGKKMDTLIRQVTELGIARWVPFTAERSVPRPNQKRSKDRLERWQTLVKESLKQSRRSAFTEVSPIISYQEVLTLGQAHQVKIVFWENETEPLENVIHTYPADSRNICIVLGPEGGFAEKEIETARSMGFKTASLGSRILRAETASISACVLIQYVFGDLGRA
jgi:16S rRNA (uracil1498-N3)-methyltransferase